jgi:arsenate reductase
MTPSKHAIRKKLKVLFICTHNSVRSQMAEGLLNAYLGHVYEAFSAGVEQSEVHPYAVRIMKEIGIDISGQKSKGLDVFRSKKFDFVVTVCDWARESCLYFPPGGKIIHKEFEDPAAAAGSEQERLAAFRKSRDIIGHWIRDNFEKQVI